MASDRTCLTSGDQCTVVSTASYTGSVSTLTCIFEVMNGSESLMRVLPNCSATVCALTGIPSGMSHDWDAIAFHESRCANCSDCHMPVDVTFSTLSCGSNSFLVRDTLSFDSVCKIHCSSLTFGEACGVACSDGHTAAEDTEIRMKCVFDLDLSSMLPEDSTHACKWASCDLSTLALSSTANHDGPKTVFGKSTHARSGTAAFTVLTGGQYFTGKALTGFIGDHLLNGSLSGPDSASWTTGESCAVTCSEGYRAANETSGTLKYAYYKVARDPVLKGAVPKCLSVVCSRDDQLAGVRHEFRDLSYLGSCMVTCKEGYEAGGNI